MPNLIKTVTEHLEKVYVNSSFKPTNKQLQDEALDIVDEINKRFNGSFEEWLKKEKETEAHYRNLFP